MEPLSELHVGWFGGCGDVRERTGRVLRQRSKQKDLSGGTDWPGGAAGQPGRFCQWERGSVCVGQTQPAFLFLLLRELRAPASTATARKITSSAG